MAPEQQNKLGAFLKLPVQIVGPMDVQHLLREIDSIEDFMHQAALRKAGAASLQAPRMSRLLTDFAESSQINILKVEDRAAAAVFLKAIKLSAPTIHISFAADPSAQFVSKIITWLRANIHPQLLLQIGLQPTIAAGCIVRTPNHYFDFSLRRRFDEQRGLLIEKIGAVHE